MVEWPGVEEVIFLLNIGDDEDTIEHLQHALDGAIERVKTDVGNWDEYEDVPTEQLRQAALRAVAVMRVNAPDDGWRELSRDRIYISLLKGNRRRFGIS